MNEGDTLSLELSAEELEIKSKVEENRRVLQGHENELRAISSQIEQVLERKHEFDVLSRACQSLEELDELGAAELFWGQRQSEEEQRERLRFAHEKIDAFNAEVNALEKQRDAIVAQVDEQNLTLDNLHYDLRDATAREESRRHEWVVERKAEKLSYHGQVMPWARGCEEDRRFRRSLAASLALCLITGWLVSIIDLPIPELSKLTEVPERVAKLVREDMRPPPPPQVAEAEAPDEEIPEPEPAEETPPEDLPESTEPPVLAEAGPQDTKEKVKSKGILAFRDSFASRANLRPSARLGSQARLSSAGENAVGRPERSMVTTSAAGSSGGINLASISRDVGGGGGGGGGMGGVALTRVSSSIGGGDGSGAGRPLSGGAYAGRTDEEIQIVFDRYKAALYRLYNRELRKNPTLRGQLILRMTIEPDGSVSLCQLQSSDMDAPVLAQQVVDRVQGFDFGAKEDIMAVTIIYPIDFLPAA
jgi:hypothetical protein